MGPLDRRERALEIVRVDPGSCLGDLVALARLEYGDSEMANPDYLRWQYLENPAGDAIVVVARSNSGELAGQYVVIPIWVRLGTGRVMGSVSLNTLTHPDYRGRGLFTRMAKEVYAICERDKISLTVGFPNKNSYPGFVRKLQFRHIGNANVLFQVLAPMKLLRKMPSVAGSPKYSPSNISDVAVAIPGSGRSGIRIESLEFSECDSSFDEFIDNRETQRFSVEKSSAFCNWRYRAVPTRRYLAFQALDGDHLLAMCVVRMRQVKGIECAFVVEFQVCAGQQGVEAGRHLLRVVMASYRSIGAVLGGMLVNPGAPEHEIAKSVGFREIPKRLLPHDAPIIVRKNDDRIEDRVFDAARWSFTFGDYDVF